MAETPLTVGADVSRTDGNCGKVTRVVMDPVARAVTHLAVEPKHHHGLGRLVPLGLADTTASQIRLRCTMAEFENLEPAEETHFLPGGSVYPGYERDQVRVLPLYAGGCRGDRRLGLSHGDHDRQAKRPKVLDPFRFSIICVAVASGGKILDGPVLWSGHVQPRPTVYGGSWLRSG